MTEKPQTAEPFIFVANWRSGETQNAGAVVVVDLARSEAMKKEMERRGADSAAIACEWISQASSIQRALDAMATPFKTRRAMDLGDDAGARAEHEKEEANYMEHARAQLERAWATREQIELGAGLTGHIAKNPTIERPAVYFKSPPASARTLAVQMANACSEEMGRLAGDLFGQEAVIMAKSLIPEERARFDLHAIIGAEFERRAMQDEMRRGAPQSLAEGQAPHRAVRTTRRV